MTSNELRQLKEPAKGGSPLTPNAAPAKPEPIRRFGKTGAHLRGGARVALGRLAAIIGRGRLLHLYRRAPSGLALDGAGLGCRWGRFGG